MKDGYFSNEGGVWFYEDPLWPVANVRGRGLTKEDAYRHWKLIAGVK